MKRLTLVLLILTFSKLNAQTKIDFNQYPFDIEALQKLSTSKDSIMPQFIEDKFYYINTKTKQQVSYKAFQVAYPFSGCNSTVVGDGKRFGILNRKGNFLVQPLYDLFRTGSTLSRKSVVFLDGFDSMFTEDNIYDLDNCEFVEIEIPGEPVGAKNIYSYKGENNKYGIKDYNEYSKLKTLIEPIFDSVYVIRHSYNFKSKLIVANKRNEIGIVNEFNEIILPFNYSDITVSKSEYSQLRIIGLKKDNVWEYYSLGNTPELILKSKFRCTNIDNICIKNALGIYETKSKKFNILFRNGSSLKKEYDWISDNGALAIDNSKVYIIGGDGVPFLYYGCCDIK